MKREITIKLQLLLWAEEGVLHKRLKRTHMNLLSYSPDSIPTLDSPSRPVAQINWKIVDITEFVLHDDTSFTLLTPEGNVRFWPKGTKGVRKYDREIHKGAK